MSFEPISRYLSRAIQNAGIAKQVTAAQVLEKAQRLIEKLWGGEKSGYTEVVSFADGTLKIRAKAPAAAQELKLWQTRLINDLNRELGAKMVRALQVIN